MTTLASKIDGLSAEKRALLARRLRQRGAALNSFPLSFAQERLWFLDQVQPGNPFYNVATAVRLGGALRPAVLAAVLDEVRRRHEALRTTFLAIDGKPVQRIAPPAAAPLPVVDLAALAAGRRQDVAAALARAEALRPFDLSRGPLLRHALLRHGADDHALLLTLHHIVADGWSMGVLVREVRALYPALAAGQPSPLPELPIQVADFAHWQRRQLAGETLERQMSYWRRRLDALPVLELPTDRPRPPAQSFRGRRTPYPLPAALCEAVRGLGRRQGATLFMALLAAFKVLLARVTGQEDVVVGTAVANRNRREIEPLIGFFVNALVLRTDLGGRPDFPEVLARVRQTTLEAQAHQDLPFEKLVWELQPQRDASRNPLFQALFALENAPLPSLDLPGLEVRPFSPEGQSAKFDLHLDVWERRQGLVVVWEYATDLFDAATIARMAGHFRTLLAAIVARPEAPVSALPLLAPGERQQLVREWSDTRRPYPRDRSINELFAEQAAARPEAVAVVAEDLHLSYGDLDRRANRLAHHLRALGVAPESTVALCVERSAALLVATLAVLKAGGAYLPLDPEVPQDRLRWLLADARATVLILEDALAARVPAGEVPWRTVRLGAEAGAIARRSAAPPPDDAPDPRRLAYLMYTSGSTGRPKGVAVPHRAVVRLVRNTGYARFDPGQVFCQLAPASFDAATLEIWGSLLNGARLVVMPAGKASARQLARAFARHGVSFLWLTAALFRQMVDEELADLAGVAQLLAGGDVLPPAHVRRLRRELPGTALVNGYGPTENTTFSCCHPVAGVPPPEAAVPIGRPIAQTRAWVVDRNLQLLPAGVPGELVVAGDGLARGYHGDPRRSAERFVPDPLGGRPGDRLYRTGDLVRWRADGTLDFQGRIDRQVKVRGFRIEPAEIEAVLAAHPAVREAAVLARREDDGEQRLVAYVAAASAGARGCDPSEQVASWRQVFDTTYRRSSADPRLDLTGWHSSYAGEPIPEAEMREWVADTVAPILAGRPRRVLEVGCGTGLLLFRVAPHCARYLATDFSPEVLGTLRRRLAAAGPAYGHVEVAERAAGDWRGVPDAGFDAVVLNSVVQYFPSVDYLLGVIAHAVRALAPGGRLLVGDVRSRPLLRAFHASVERFRAPPELTARELSRRVELALSEENELTLDPGFFLALEEHLPRVRRVRVLPKRGRAHNELTGFRYQVEIEVGATQPRQPAAAWIDWQREGLSLAAVRRLLAGTAPATLGLANVPNARLTAVSRVLAALAPGADGNTVAALRQTASGADPGVEIEDLFALAAEAGYELEVSWARHGESGDFDALLRRDGGVVAVAWPREKVPPRPWHHYGNDPLQGALVRKLVPELRHHLRRHLPDYMVPAVFVLLDSLPLNANGKVDRTALGAMAAPALEWGRRDAAAGAFVVPATPVEEALCRIWGEVLGFDRIGARDDFFDLGGHSLLATQVVSRIRAAFGVELPLQTFFDHATVAELASAVGELQRRGGVHPPPPLVPLTRDGPVPLSFAQERLWFLSRLAPESASYNEPIGLAVQGRLEVSALAWSLGEIVRRHEVLRTVFPEVDGHPVQLVGAPGAPAMPRVDLSALPAAARGAEAGRLARRRHRLPFDLARGPLLRVTLVRLAENSHHLLLSLHHVVFDGWSTGILVRELQELYAAAVAGRPPDLRPLALQYADFAAWQRRWLQGEALEARLAHWRRRLAAVPALDLPTDRPRPTVTRHRGAQLPIELPPPLTAAVRALARRRAATPFMTLLAAFAAVLHRYTGRPVVVVGAPVAGRNHADVEDLIGFFVNMLVLVNDCCADPSFDDLVTLVRQVTLAAYEHQDLPFERLVEELRPERDLGGNPLFQVAFQLLSSPPGRLELPGLRVEALPQRAGTAKFDLSLALAEGERTLAGWLEFSTELFDATTAARLRRHFETLLAGAVADPGRRLSELPVLAPWERHELLREVNDTGTAGAGLVHVRIAARARSSPDAVAVEGRGQALSYCELAARAGRLARTLQSLGARTESVVAVCAQRTPEMVVALLAVLETGAAYLPLDPAYPPARRRFMLADSGAALLLAHRHLVADLGATVPVVDLEEAAAGPGAEPLPAAVAPDNLAYVIYTSGSTGRPKGVAVVHRGVAALLRWAASAFAAAELEAVLAATSLCFDLSVFEVFAPLCQGGRVVVAAGALDLVDLAGTTRVRLVNTVPSAARELLRLDALPPSVTAVNLAGEALPRDLLVHLLERPAVRRVRNLYGPSEDTTYSTAAVLERPPGGAPSIGRPIPGTRAHVLDPRGRLLPPGVPGELYLAGEGLARGYLVRPALTAERFLPDPRAPQPGARLYRTGDAVRWRCGGELEFLGRRDDQVKVRGHRVEPGEIEAVLDGLPGVAECAVVARPEAGGGLSLVAYVAGPPGAAPDSGELLRRLGGRLPRALVPAAVEVLESLPRTPNGKLDRGALRRRAEAATAGAGGDDAPWAPHDPVEEILAEVWSEVLGGRRPRRDDDFFAVGGHSLLATQVVARVRDLLAVEVPLRAIFLHPTLEGLAGAVREAMKTGAGPRLPPLTRTGRSDGVPLSFGQERLWFLQQLEPASASYNVPTAVRLTGRLERAALAASLREVVRRQEALRTRFARRGARPVQEVAPPWEVAPPVVDLRALPPFDRRREARRLSAREAARPFDLERGRLLRGLLQQLADDEHVLLLTLHHVAADGWSLGVLLREVAAGYRALSHGRSPDLPELPVQFADFSRWQRGWLRGDVLAEQLAFWRRHLGGDPPALALPTDRPRPAVLAYRGGGVSVRLPELLAGALRVHARRRGATLFMALLAAFAGWLQRHAGQPQVVVGTPIANRGRRELEGLIGFFANTLALVVRFDGRPGFDALLAQVRETALGAYAHQDLPFEKLVEVLEPERDLSRTPLFQAMLVLQNTPAAPAVELPALTLTSLEPDDPGAKFDLSLSLRDAGTALAGRLSYDAGLFDATTVRRMLGRFEVFLAAALDRPEVPVADLPLLAAAERHQLLVEANAGGPPAAPGLVHERFAAHAAATPERIAAVAGDRYLCFQELAARGRRLARRLRALGTGPEVPVAVALDRSPEFLVAILGVLEAGGAYVALEATQPAGRLALLVREAGASVLVARTPTARALGDRVPHRICLDAGAAALGAPSPRAGDDPGVRPENLAYCLFTSGSTGLPKAVMIEHRQLVNYLEGVTARLELPAGGHYAMVSTVAADLGNTSLFSALCGGGTLHLIPEADAADPRAVARLFERRPIDCLKIVPSHLQALHAYQERPALPRRRLILGGEAADPHWLAGLAGARPPCRIDNHYGPTESTVGVLTRRLDGRPVGLGATCLGEPLAGVQVYVADAALWPVPTPAPGELLIGGAGLARGYLGRPGRTAERFVPDPFAGRPAGGRLYRTGDRARRLADGRLEFLGRVDDQVKIRGFRIEPGEVAATLARHPRLREVVVVAREVATSGPALVAYVVPRGDGAPDVAELRAFAAELLPAPMVPSAFVALAALPRTANGKVDARALPAPERARPELKAGYAAPRSELERRIARVWRRVLRVDRVGVHDSFFDLGGHSLLAVEAQGELRRELAREVPLIDLFRHPTVYLLARSLEPAGDRPEASAAALEQRRTAAKARIRRQALRRRSGGGDAQPS